MEPISHAHYDYCLGQSLYCKLPKHLLNEELGEGGPALDEWPMKLTMIKVKTSSYMVIKFKKKTYKANYKYVFGGGLLCWESNIDGLFFITSEYIIYNLSI